MADNQALLASLLLGQRKRTDPLEERMKFGQAQMTAGAETTPVYSPLQGIARALQGGVGGLFAGYADQQQKQEDTDTGAALSKAAQATTPQELAAALTGIKGNSEMNAVLGQIVQGRLGELQKQQQAGTALAPYGITPPSGGNGGTSITITPGKQQPPGSVPQPPAASDNNIMNLRATDIPWQGKGAPAGGFETFNTPQAGANATVQNFAAYVKENPNITVAQAIAKWAPAGDGKNNPDAYVSQVSETTGINPSMRLADVMQNPVDMARLMEAGTGVEKGRMPAGVTPDVLVNASGQQQPGQPAAQPQPQVAQAQPQAQPAPQQGSPPGNVLREQAKRLAASGENAGALELAKKATEADAQWATKVGEQNLGQPQENARNEHNLRQEFDQIPTVKEYRKAATTFRSAIDASKANTAAADLNMVYAFATMMDPGSVVREGEMGMVRATQNASDQVKSMVAMVTGGQRLSPEARASLLSEMNNRYQSYKAAHDDLATSYEGFASRSGMNPQNAIARLPDVPFTAAPKAVQPSTGGVPAGEYEYRGGKLVPKR